MTHRPPGATWWKVDFHAHSPASFDFGADEGSLATVSTEVKDWLLAYMAAEVDVVVITDHNTGEGIEPARVALAELRETCASGFRELTILTGVELTVLEGFHLLAVFDIDTPKAQIDRLLERCDYRGDRGDSNGTTANSFEQVAKEIFDDGGLAIPAHCETRGFFKMDERSQGPIAQAGLIAAAEVTTEEGARKALALGWVPVLGSDAHHLDGSGAPGDVEAKYPGSHYTWVRMETPNLTGIRIALADGETSVVRSTTGSTDPNTVLHGSIRSIEVTRNGETYSQHFSPWMNALIGGRGVGKSTILEILRLAMGRFEELPGRLGEDLNWFSPEVPRGTESRYWDEHTAVSVIYSKLGNEYRIAWSGSAPQASTIEKWDGSTWVQEQGLPADRFPLLMYSQKQIYETAQKPQTLLRMIDQQPAVDHAGWTVDAERLADEYRTKRAVIGQLRGTIETEAHVSGELSDVDAKLTLIGVYINSGEAAELDTLVRAESDRMARETAVSELAQAVEAAVHTFDNTLSTDGVESEWAPAVARASVLERFRLRLGESLADLHGSTDSWTAERLTSPRLARIEELQAIVKTQAEGLDPALTGGVSADPAAYRAELMSRKEMLEGSVREIASARASLAEELAAAADLLAKIAEHRSDLTNRRRNFALQITKPDFKLEVFTQADEDQLEVELRSLTQKPTLFDPVFAKDDGFRKGLPHPQDPSFAGRIESLKEILKAVQRDGASSPHLAALGAIEGRFLTHLTGLDSSQFETEVDLWFPPDRLQVRYKQQGESRFRELDQGSPGQKTAALLAVILELNTDPLVLDQPEDDLDNELISELVVKVLKKSKTGRQVITVTHNANVVVNADAELVVVLKHGENVPEAIGAGSIQVEGIKDAVCLIMEGGEDAFLARYKRLVKQ